MKYKLLNDVNRSEHPWLDRDFKTGEIVFSYPSCTYGCISHIGIACTEIKDEDPFFELPLDSLKIINEVGS